MDGHRLSRFENFANHSLSATTVKRMGFRFDAIEGFHVKGILLRVFKEKG
jgi:hypothetical protein